MVITMKKERKKEEALSSGQTKGWVVFFVCPFLAAGKPRWIEDRKDAKRENG